MAMGAAIEENIRDSEERKITFFKSITRRCDGCVWSFVAEINDSEAKLFCQRRRDFTSNVADNVKFKYNGFFG